MASAFAVSPAAAFRVGSSKSSRAGRRSVATQCSQQDPLLLRVARGEGAGTLRHCCLLPAGHDAASDRAADSTSGVLLEAGKHQQRRVRFSCTAVVSSANPCPPPLPAPVLPAEAERTPVWLMRQAGRYMAAFREYSDRIPFRERSETASIAIELSLQVGRGRAPRCAAAA